MSTAAATSSGRMMTEENVMQLIADALDVSRNELTLKTKATDVSAWDSMGILSILASLDRERIACDIGDTDSLQSVHGILNVVRTAGRLE